MLEHSLSTVHMAMCTEVFASGGDRGQNYAGVEGNTVSPSGGGPAKKPPGEAAEATGTGSVPVLEWQEAARLRERGTWSNLQYEAWSVTHLGLPTSPHCDFRRYAHPGQLHAEAAPDQGQGALKGHCSTPVYKKVRPQYGVRGRASRRSLALRGAVGVQKPLVASSSECSDELLAEAAASVQAVQPRRKQCRLEAMRRQQVSTHARPLSAEEVNLAARQRRVLEQARAAAASMEFPVLLPAASQRAADSTRGSTRPTSAAGQHLLKGASSATPAAGLPYMCDAGFDFARQQRQNRRNFMKTRGRTGTGQCQQTLSKKLPVECPDLAVAEEHLYRCKDAQGRVVVGLYSGSAGSALLHKPNDTRQVFVKASGGRSLFVRVVAPG